METQGRASDGRRRFTAEFKRDQISRVIRGQITLSELSREIDVSPSVVRRWKHLVDRGSQTAVTANEGRWPGARHPCRRSFPHPQSGQTPFRSGSRASASPPAPPPPRRF